MKLRNKLLSFFSLKKLRKHVETHKYLKRRIKKHPEFKWRFGANLPQRRVEASRVQIGPELYIIGGYITLGKVSKRVDIYNMETNRWRFGGFIPEDMPETHNGAVYDGENHIYLISGQFGADCSPASAVSYSFDIRDHSWQRIPSLPEPRYMPLAHFHEGRIHCISGGKQDRFTPSNDHWSIGVRDGKATEATWRVEVPTPITRTHTASQMIGDEVFIFGGQEGDVPAIEGDPNYKCNFRTPMDVVMDEVYAFHLKTGAVRKLASMPEKISHTEHSVVQHGSNIIIAGGVLNRNTMCDIIVSYDLEIDRWEIIGRLPYPMKSKAVGLWNNRLYLVTGQKSVSDVDMRPAQLLETVWHAGLPSRFII